MTTAKITSSAKDGEITWVTINGLDFGTQHEFNNDSFGVLENGDLIDDDGAPLTIGDYLEIAVNNVLRKGKFNLENLNMQYVASNEYNEQIENGAILECSKSWTINSLQTWLPDCDFDTLESVKNWLSGESYIAEGMYLKVWF